RPLEPGVRRFAGAEAGRENVDLVAAPRELPGDGIAVAAVVAGSADHGGPSSEGEALPQRVGDAERGVLHQHRSRNAELLDGATIELPALGEGEDAHVVGGRRSDS